METWLRSAWMTDSHEVHLRTREVVTECSGGRDTYLFDAEKLRGTPFSESAWGEYFAVSRRVSGLLTPPMRELFEVAQTLARIAYPMVAEFDPLSGTTQNLDELRPRGEVAPRLAELIRSAKGRGLLPPDAREMLADFDDRGSRAAWRMMDVLSAALEAAAEAPSVATGGAPALGVLATPSDPTTSPSLQDAVQELAGQDAAAESVEALSPTLEAAAEAPSVTPDVTSDAGVLAPPSDPATPPCVQENAPAVVSQEPAHEAGEVVTGKELARLKAIKKRIDPKDEYIGESLPILRMFEMVDVLNRNSDASVVILGPSGSGKTALASLIHKASKRDGKPFVSRTLDRLSGGDPTIRRSALAGVGKSSGLANMPQTGVTGVYKEAEGGTIFFDELHSADKQTLDELRAVLDKQPIPLAAGVGPDVVLDVRLIFATFRPIKELCAEGMLPADFVRRLGTRWVTVPPVAERKGDILLFVEKKSHGFKIGECFLLALMRHDWLGSEVDGLLNAIRSATCEKKAGQVVLAEDIAEAVPDTILSEIEGITRGQIRKTLYPMLVSALKGQGFVIEGRGKGLQRRLAEILGTKPSATVYVLSEGTGAELRGSAAARIIRADGW